MWIFFIDFETKLQSMGFAVSSSPAIGHVAVADIKSSGSRSNLTPKVGSTIPHPVLIEERKITTTSFGDNRVCIVSFFNIDLV